MSIADKLTILAASKEMVRLKLGIGEDVPFSEYSDHIGWDGITSDLGQSTTTAASQKLVTDEATSLQTSIAAILGINKKLTNRINALEESNIYEMFNNGSSNGIWLDPSDLKTMFQDALGTVPVTKDGDPVGLILDKSQGIHGESLLDTSYPFEMLEGTIREGEIIHLQRDSAGVSIRASNLSIKKGAMYKVSFYVESLDGDGVNLAGVIVPRLNNSIRDSGGTASKVGYFETYIRSSEDGNLFQLNHASSGINAKIRDISVQEVKGNHASQPLAASRPTYRTDGILHWLQFDGVDDELSISVTLGINSLLSASILSNRFNNSFVFGEVGKGAKMGMFSNSAFFRLVPNGDAVTIPYVAASKHIITGFRDNGYTSGRLNGVEGKATAPIATAQATWATLGSANTTNQYFSGSIYGAILLDDYSADKVIKIENYLSAKAGVEI